MLTVFHSLKQQLSCINPGSWVMLYLLWSLTPLKPQTSDDSCTCCCCWLSALHSHTCLQRQLVVMLISPSSTSPCCSSVLFVHYGNSPPEWRLIVGFCMVSSLGFNKTQNPRIIAWCWFDHKLTNAAIKNISNKWLNFEMSVSHLVLTLAHANFKPQ